MSSSTCALLAVWLAWACPAWADEAVGGKPIPSEPVGSRQGASFGEKGATDLQAVLNLARKAPPLAKPAGKVLRVSDAAGLRKGVASAEPGTTILLANGRYSVDHLVIRQDRLSLRGESGDRDKVILDGGGKLTRIVVVESGKDLLFADLTLANSLEYGIFFYGDAGAHRLRVYNVKFANCLTRGLKGTDAAKVRDSWTQKNPPEKERQLRPIGGQVRYCLFVNDRPSPRLDLYHGDYIGGIDIMSAKDWVVADNVFVDIRGQRGGGRGAVFFWVNGENVVVERNIIVGCDRGICFGNPATPLGALWHVTGGVIRNNFISAGTGEGIEVCRAKDVLVAHNSVWMARDNARAVQLHVATPGCRLANNLIRGTADAPQDSLGRGNILGELAGWFARPEVGDLHLTEAAKPAVGKAKPLKEVGKDFDGQKRKADPDIGADETGPPVAEWTTLGHDAARTSYSPVRVKPPYREKWYWLDGKRFEIDGPAPPDRLRTWMSRRAQPVTDGKLVFIGSMSDRTLYAIDLASGQTRWGYRAAGPILEAAATAGGVVFVADTAGVVHAVSAADGTVKWTFTDPHRGSFYACPAVVDGQVFIGSRSGWFFALDAATGKPNWQFEAGAEILNSPAVADGGVFFGDEAMFVRRLDARTGREVWKKRLHGWTFRHHAPVVATVAGLIVWRSCPILDEGAGAILDKALAEEGDKAVSTGGDQGAAEAMARLSKDDETDGAFRAAQLRARKALAEHPEARTFFALSLADGSERLIVPAGYQAQHADVPPPPVALPDGRMVGYYRGRFGTLKGVIYSSRYMLDIGYLDPKTGLFDRLGQPLSVEAPFGIRGDDCARLSVGGDILYGNWNHRGSGERERNCGAWDLRTSKTWPLGQLGGLRKDDPLKRPDVRTGNSHAAVVITANGTLLVNHLGVAVVALESAKDEEKGR